ncbi:MAG: ATP-binding protein [Cohaesibacteraceae bacterium]
MSFRLKTILGIALIEVVVLATLVGNSLHHLKTTNEQELFTRAKVTTQLLATMTSDATISFDLATLDSLVQQTLRNEGLVYIRIRNKEGLVLSEGGDADALNAPFVSDESARDADDQRIDLSAPIVVGGNEFGSVETGLSTHLLDTVLADGTKRMLTIAGVEIVLVALFGFALGTVLTRQLARLRRSAKRVAGGEFGHQMTVTGRDELADTANSFNKMSSSLAEYAKEAQEARERAEAGRAYAETLLRDAMNSVSQSIFIVDSDGRLEFANRAALRMYPISKEQTVAGTPFEDVLLPIAEATVAGTDQSELRFVDERMQRLSLKSKGHSWQSRLKDGTVIVSTQHTMSNGGAVLVDTDITEQYEALEKNQKLELELLQAHKLESLGTLASGVAHEINTPTQFIGDNIRFLSGSFDDLVALVSELSEKEDAQIGPQLEAIDWDFLREEVPAALSEAANGVESIGKIVRSIKEFSHPDDGECQETDIRNLIETAATVSRSQWRHSAELSVECRTKDTVVPCYPGDLSQVLINLIVNAADAIADGQKDQEADRGTIAITVDRVAQSLVIDVADNGGGIDPEIQRRIFDMFFTTKAPGKGTGQGLAICRSLIEGKHHGRLSVSSKLGNGSAFRIELPVLQQTAVSSPKAA